MHVDDDDVDYLFQPVTIIKYLFHFSSVFDGHYEDSIQRYQITNVGDSKFRIFRICRWYQIVSSRDINVTMKNLHFGEVGL